MSVAIFLDGESKGGKTAVGRAIADKLNGSGLATSLVVAGHFFRRLALLSLEIAPDNRDDLDWLEPAVTEVLKFSSKLYDLDYDASQLDSPEVDEIVSSVGQLEVSQSAVGDWRRASAERALETGSQVVIFDGRNLRAKMEPWLETASVATALELVIFCNARAAARRYLADSGNSDPSEGELANVSAKIERRRQLDRTRPEAPYQDPVDPVLLVAGKDNAKSALASATDSSVANSPRPVLFDNSEVPKKVGLATVSELAWLAVSRMGF